MQASSKTAGRRGTESAFLSWPLNSTGSGDKNLTRTALSSLENARVDPEKSEVKRVKLGTGMFASVTGIFCMFWPRVGCVSVFVLMASEGRRTGQSDEANQSSLYCGGLLVIGAEELLKLSP